MEKKSLLNLKPGKKNEVNQEKASVVGTPWPVLGLTALNTIS